MMEKNSALLDFINLYHVFTKREANQYWLSIRAVDSPHVQSFVLQITQIRA